MTTNLNEYPSVKEYQLNFKSILQKLHVSGAALPKNLQLAAFFHGMEETYSQWSFAKRSTTRSKAKDEDFPIIEDFTAELLNGSLITVAAEAKALAASKVKNGRKNGDRPRTKCTFCEIEENKEDNWWKNHLKKCPTRFKLQDSTNHASINQDSTDDESIPKRKKKIRKVFWHCSFCSTVNKHCVYYEHHKDSKISQSLAFKKWS